MGSKSLAESRIRTIESLAETLSLSHFSRPGSAYLAVKSSSRQQVICLEHFSRPICVSYLTVFNANCTSVQKIAFGMVNVAGKNLSEFALKTGYDSDSLHRSIGRKSSATMVRSVVYRTTAVLPFMLLRENNTNDAAEYKHAMQFDTTNLVDHKYQQQQEDATLLKLESHLSISYVDLHPLVQVDSETPAHSKKKDKKHTSPAPALELLSPPAPLSEAPGPSANSISPSLTSLNDERIGPDKTKYSNGPAKDRKGAHYLGLRIIPVSESEMHYSDRQNLPIFTSLHYCKLGLGFRCKTGFRIKFELSFVLTAQ
ncbi:Uncharacterized protein Fot_16722 [Forsythia ovata]|uniref:Uncharacterized protein n=1 Tax=Forsythia ovata TaxID=205694 RepID=A0ABD1VDA6_9LAMI